MLGWTRDLTDTISCCRPVARPGACPCAGRRQVVHRILRSSSGQKLARNRSPQVSETECRINSHTDAGNVTMAHMAWYIHFHAIVQPLPFAQSSHPDYSQKSPAQRHMAGRIIIQCLLLLVRDACCRMLPGCARAAHSPRTPHSGCTDRRPRRRATDDANAVRTHPPHPRPSGVPPTPVGGMCASIPMIHSVRVHGHALISSSCLHPTTEK